MTYKNRLYLKGRSFINKLKDRTTAFFRMKGFEFYLERGKAIELIVDELIRTKYYAFDGFQKNVKIYSTLPIEKAKTLSGLNFFNIENHHSVIALRSAIMETSNKIELESLLYKYYIDNTIKDNKDIKSLEDIFNLNNSKLIKYPPWAVFLPWNAPSKNGITNFLDSYDFSVYVENHKRGLGVGAYKGGSQYVFTSPKRASLESKLISQLYFSIKDNGFDEAKNLKDPIGAVILTDGERYSWIVSAGIHRTCVLKVMNFKEIKVQIKGVIYREDYKYWNGVKSGLFTEEEALHIFDLFFK